MDGAIYRILDANANRAREALRTLEEYARFALNNDAIARSLKQLRHDLATTYQPFVHNAVLFRDVPGDVGTSIRTESEQRREDIGSVVTAAAGRLGEALRVLAEYLKPVDSSAAEAMEALRYRFYAIEREILLTLRPRAFEDVQLYVLITESLCGGRPWLEVARAALDGGADCLQLREKDLPSGELLARARALVALCEDYIGAICIINDRPDIALLSGADGVHVGQDDLPAAEARKIIGPGKLLGVSTHNMDQARAAEAAGADYIGVGPVFPSKTKPRDILPGLEFASAAAGQVGIPCVAIAGITLENAESVWNTGVSALAVSSAVISAPDPRAAAKALKCEQE